MTKKIRLKKAVYLRVCLSSEILLRLLIQVLTEMDDCTESSSKHTAYPASKQQQQHIGVAVAEPEEPITLHIWRGKHLMHEERFRFHVSTTGDESKTAAASSAR